MVDCVICNKSIHFDHNEGELMKCLKQMNLKLAETNKFLKEIIPLVDKVLILNGAGTKYKDGGYHHA